jgi:hypothetical protein
VLRHIWNTATADTLADPETDPVPDPQADDLESLFKS